MRISATQRIREQAWVAGKNVVPGAVGVSVGLVSKLSPQQSTLFFLSFVARRRVSVHVSWLLREDIYLVLPFQLQHRGNSPPVLYADGK